MLSLFARSAPRTLRPLRSSATAPAFQFTRALLVVPNTAMDYSSVPTPAACYADFCLIPVGTGNVSVAEDVAEVQRLLEASGLTVTMHSAGTTVEGSWDDVMRVIGQAHTVVHQRGVLRVQSSMRVGTRTDKKQTAADKVQRVKDILGKEEA
ncbi:cell wall biogenesis protein [Ophiostoma piceae UAMH 11346]|uniref:Cell wall biogenesis protein n=1 Tax=Ophiostoma piceae (strain UAMH 11346) TaxID=1262450 RepID=S3BZK9_OPHP1|nr:cell wall biogenesis protein [Ophiostoma piceae UAMH 11346]